MNVTVIGNGSIGRAYYAFLSENGHDVSMWSPSGSVHRDFRSEALLESTGKVSGMFSMRAHETLIDAIQSADAIIISTPANGFASVIDALVPIVATSQHIIFSSHSSLAALCLAKRLSARGVYPVVSGWSTTILTARKTGARSVNVSNIRSLVDVAAVPVRKLDEAIEMCCALFGNRFAARQNVLALTLNNLNPPVHAANMLGNLTRAEKGENWPNHDITPAVGEIIQAMDDERLALANEFGLRVRTVQDHFLASFGVQHGTVHEMAQVVFNQRPELKGPTTLVTRFITEDVPYGLYPLEVLARTAGVAMPLHTAAIELFSAICRKDFRADNTLIAGLRNELSDRAQLLAALEMDIQLVPRAPPGSW